MVQGWRGMQGIAQKRGCSRPTHAKLLRHRRHIPPPRSYPSSLSFSLPPARSLWRHIKRVRFLFPAFSRHHHRYSSVTQGASGAAKNSSLDFFLFITTLAPILLIIRKDLRFCLLVYMIWRNANYLTIILSNMKLGRNLRLSIFYKI